MRRKVYLTKNERGGVFIDTNLRDAKKSCLYLNDYGICAKTDTLPKSLCKSLDKEYVLEIFEKHQEDVENIWCYWWSLESSV